jgi:hypothetical protein
MHVNHRCMHTIYTPYMLCTLIHRQRCVYAHIFTHSVFWVEFSGNFQALKRDTELFFFHYQWQLCLGEYLRWYSGGLPCFFSPLSWVMGYHFWKLEGNCLYQFPPPSETSCALPDQIRSCQDLQWPELWSQSSQVLNKVLLDWVYVLATLWSQQRWPCSSFLEFWLCLEAGLPFS